MLFALSPMQPERLDALCKGVAELREKAKRLQMVPPAHVSRESVEFSHEEVDGQRLLLVDGSPDLAHHVWTAAMKAGFDVRGGHLPDGFSTPTFEPKEGST